jgi:hypothetical protein
MCSHFGSALLMIALTLRCLWWALCCDVFVFVLCFVSCCAAML